MAKISNLHILEEKMAKKIAIALIMIMLVNSIVWAQTETDYSFLEEPGFIALCIGLAVLPLLIYFLMSSYDGTAEAYAPDDGIRLVSKQNNGSESISFFRQLLNIISHIEVGKTMKNDFYTGFRLRF